MMHNICSRILSQPIPLVISNKKYHHQGEPRKQDSIFVVRWVQNRKVVAEIHQVFPLIRTKHKENVSDSPRVLLLHYNRH